MQLSANTTYRARVYDYISGTPSTTTFTIQLTQPYPPPSNNDCSGATQLVLNAAPTNGDVLGATQTTSANCVGNADDDVWYYFTTGPLAGQHVLTVVPSASMRPVVEILGGSCNGRGE